MKEEPYTEIICRKFCQFYKGGKEELQCGTYLYLKASFSSKELAGIVPEVPVVPLRDHDKIIENLICKQCDFLTDGCDFREGLDSPPCGGYAIVEHLLRNMIISGK